MQRYTYKFVWLDKDGIYQRKHLEAGSKEAAIIDFEKTFNVVVKGRVKVVRLFGKNS